MRDVTRQVEDETVKWAMSDVAPMSDDAFDRGRAALLARIDAEESGKVVALAPRRRRRIPVVAAAAAMVVIAGAALVAPSMMSREKGPNVGSAAAAELLSQAANLTGDATLQPGQYLYVLQNARWSMTEYDHRWMYLQDQKLQTWIPADRKGSWLYRRDAVGDRQWLIGSPQDLSPTELNSHLDGSDEYRSEGGPALHDKIKASFRDPSPEYLASLPSDPKELYQKLRDEVSGDEGLVFLQMVNDGLDTGVYPAAVRSAVYQALSHLPKLEIVEKTAVIDSRSGTALGVTENETTEQIVIDQATGEYLGSRTVLAKDAWGLKRGQVVGTTSVTTKVVAGMGLAA
ncbi:CU044_5270 family protein [Lentzea sp. NBC_00516]|uniref:CU044_5270 family protein n=1 Tax=Lentzea sp. NBC_00516 TaxID=2903582 RepID=UPI002E80556D|nr:CU044_5270 family protein [Lentzea sp. NBC_00516]WUD29151.1 CU044_5270 family protein [Lentzea sp. NBC_00516]